MNAESQPHGTTYREWTLTGTSRKLTVPLHEGELDEYDLGLEPFDLGLFVSSYELRSTAVTSCRGLSLREARCIRFQNSDDNYHRRLMNFLASVSERVGPDIHGQVEDLERLGSQIEHALCDAYAAKRGALTVFVDITCLEKYYLLLVLGSCFRNERCRRLVCYYSEGKYQQVKGDYIFTAGEWEAVSVPYFLGENHPAYNRFYLVAAGFEGVRALRFLRKHDPDRVCALVPDPGFSTDYLAEMYKKNRLLFEEFGVNGESQLKAEAADAIAAWKALDTPGLYRDRENISFVCFGTKPHALGLGLRALVHPEVEVVYGKPKEFLPKEVVPTGEVWLYDIKDLRQI